MLGVEDERDVHHLGGDLAGLLAAHAPEQVGGMCEGRVRLDRSLTIERHLVHTNASRDLREQPHGLSEFSFGTVVLTLNIVVRKKRHGSAENTHGVGFWGVFGDPNDRIADMGRNASLRLEHHIKCSKLFGRWFVADKKQMSNFLEGGMRGQVGDLIASIYQLCLIYRADAGITNGLSGQSARIRRLRCRGRHDLHFPLFHPRTLLFSDHNPSRSPGNHRAMGRSAMVTETAVPRQAQIHGKQLVYGVEMQFVEAAHERARRSPQRAEMSHSSPGV